MDLTRIGTLLILATAGLLPAAAGAQTADTLDRRTALFTLRDAAIAGGFTATAAILAPLDASIARELQSEQRQGSMLLSRSATVFRLFGTPGGLIAGAGTYALGAVTGQRRTQDLGLHTVEALLVASAVTGAIKTVAGRARPRVNIEDPGSFKLLRGLGNDAYRSFPSGHATQAFAFAAVVSSETVRWWPGTRWVIGPVMYGAAALTGVSRIYNNEHWASDVAIGAAIGTFTGLKIYRYQHSHPGNTLDRTLLRAGLSHSGAMGWMPHLSVASY